MNARHSYCNPSLELTACREGERFLVQAVHGEGAERLRDIGVREGALVSMLKNRGDVIVRIAGSRVGLREDMARKVLGTTITA